MGYLAIQIAVYLTIAVIAGAMVGWWVARFIYLQQEAECRAELAGLRRNYDDAALENASLRHKLRQLEKVVRKASIPPSDCDYGRFLQLRKALEKTRSQYQELLGHFHQQEKSLAHLKTELQDSKRQLTSLKDEIGQQAAGGAAGEKDAWPTPLGNEADDLTRIQGINQGLAGKLQALGIFSYRQLAEFTLDELQGIQRLIGADIPQVSENWAKTAQSLWQQKYLQA